jgi:hypothetical protein
MALYYKENQIPSRLPHSITLMDTQGNTYTRTDPSSFTEEEIAQAGYFKAPDKPRVVPVGQQVHWNPKQKNWVILSTVKSKPALTKAQKWEKVREERDKLLAQADARVLYNYEHNITDENLTAYRQALRDITITYRNPDAVQWPELETDNV